MLAADALRVRGLASACKANGNHAGQYAQIVHCTMSPNSGPVIIRALGLAGDMPSDLVRIEDGRRRRSHPARAPGCPREPNRRCGGERAFHLGVGARKRDAQWLQRGPVEVRPVSLARDRFVSRVAST